MRKILPLFFWLSMVLILQGCPQPVHVGSASSSYEESKPKPEPAKEHIPSSFSDPFEFENNIGRKQYIPPPPTTVEEADNIIARDEKMIKALQKSESEHRAWEVIRAVQDSGDRGAVKLTGGPEYADLQGQRARQVAGHEREIIRLKKVVKQAKEAREELLDQSVGCFLPDTLVQMGDGSLKPFVKVMPGDRVMSYDVGHKKQVSREVVAIYSVQSNHLYKINGEFETTGGERLLTEDGWKEISSLKKEDIIHINGEMVEVSSLEYSRTKNTLHNLQVENTHNFYVSTANGTKYLVHNSDGGDGGGGK
ncbi:MAG: hypothetical protein DRQ47_06225 [Gammaproteobacteria bacterium]|nr:MAG: hypothetical protein DRQ47_06225 [Gammaproteobacteria bacterium]RLB66745.1 MAG: hypothetical protein DRH08_05390 [Deltaproteobacteria bacterium]